MAASDSTRSQTLPKSGSGSRAAKRKRSRRMAYLAVALALLLAAVLMNRVPVATYFQAKGALEAEQQQVAQIQAQLDSLKEQAATLSDPARLELEARKDLSYARPGEEMFVVEGLDDETNNGTSNGTSSTAGANGAAGGGEAADGAGDAASGQPADPGPLERLVRAIFDVF